jgi:hypothetical protein
MTDPVLWSTVPNGFVGAHLNLSVVASPYNGTDVDIVDSVWSAWTKAVFVGDSLRLKFYPEFTVDFASATDPNPPEAAAILPKEYVPFADIWETLFPQPSALTKKTGARTFAAAQATHSASQVARFAQSSLENDYRRSLRRLLVSSPESSRDEDIKYYLEQTSDTDSLRHLRWLNWNEHTARAGTSLAGNCAVRDEFRKWIVAHLQTQGANASVKIAEARRGERNAYRLASNPWEDLDDDALAVAWYMALDDPTSEICPTKRVEALRVADPNRFEALRLAVFYGRVRNEQHKDPEKPNFAQKIAMLNNYPRLMRKVGLIFDLSFPQELLKPDHVGVRTRVVLNGKTFGVSPWTIIKKKSTPNEFYALATDDTYVDGALNPKNVTLQSLESDTLLLKMIGHANSPASEADPQAESESSATPASNGIAIHLENRAERIKTQLRKAEDLQASLQRTVAGTPTADSSQIQVGPLGLESLVRGYVPFIADGSETFLSLCKRTEAFDFIDSGTGTVKTTWPVPDSTNGFVGASATTTHDATSLVSTDSELRDLHIHDAIVNWTGWSLGAPNRLQQLKIDPEDTVGENCRPNPSYSPMVCGNFAVERKSLTRLRFGRTYKFRVMCMDIAGNVRDASQSKVGALEHQFLRYDPVLPPEVLLTEHLSTLNSPGEQLTQLVVRSTGESRDDKECLRAIVPPRCSFVLAQLCGMFDGKSPFKTGSFNQVALGKNGSLPADMEGPTEFTAAGECTSARATNANPIYKKPSGQLEPCQYLPDPFASGFLIGVTDLSNGGSVRFDTKKLRGSTESESDVTFLNLDFYSGGRQWPRADMWILAVKPQKRYTREVSVSVEKRGFPNAGSRTFQAVVVRVPNGKEIALSLHSWVKSEDLLKMAVFSQVATKLVAVAAGRSSRSRPLNSSEIKRRLGNLPATTIVPPRRLTLVNAIPRPFVLPKISVLVPRGRQRGNTFQAFDDVQIDVERASTGTVNLVSSWEECLDTDETPGPVRISKTEVPVCETTIAPPQLLQKAIDIHARSSDKNQVCTEEPLAERPLEHLWRTRLHGTYKPAPSEPGKVRQDFGDTRHRVVNYHLIASTRFGEYFSPSPSAQRPPSSFTISILNTSVPHPPSVAYIVPTFEWTKPELLPTAEKHDRRIYRSERKGGGCRLWLNRPWCVTGDEEQLGLVVWGGSDAWDGYKETEDKVTRWGADPIWGEEATTHGPSPSDIESEMLMGEQVALPLQGTDNLPIVLPLTPKYDNANKLWYVDVHLSRVPSYFSFIRFALVRYQRNSITGCQFSPVTMAQFVQLTPDRAVSVMRVIENGKESANKLDIVLTGDLANAGNCYSVQVQEQWGSGDAKKWWVQKSDERLSCEEPRGNALASWRLTFDGDVCRRRRLVIREYEHFEEDDRVGGDTVATVKTTRRLVYADVLEV